MNPLEQPPICAMNSIKAPHTLRKQRILQWHSFVRGLGIPNSAHITLRWGIEKFKW